MREIDNWLFKAFVYHFASVVAKQSYLPMEQPIFTSEDVPEIPLHTQPRRSDDHWQEEAEKEVNQQFSWLEGPLIRVVLLKGDNVSDILLTFHHAIGDGASCVYLVRDLLHYVETVADGISPDIQALPERPPVEELLPRSAHGLDGQVKTASLIGKQLVNIFVQHPKKLPKDGDPFSKDRCARNIYRKLSEKETEAFLAKCHQESATVHGAVCAAVLQAAAHQICEACKDDPITISCMSMVNLRQFLNPPLGDEVRLYISGVITAHRVGSSTDFWDLARSVRKAVHKSVEKGEPFVFLSLLNRVIPRNATPDDLVNLIVRMYPCAILVTNAGRLDIPEQYGDFELEEYNAAVANKAVSEFFNVAVQTFRNRLIVDFFYTEPTFSQERAAALVDDAMKVLSGF
jgi:NRPS condensation-like uncharacterized protein